MAYPPILVVDEQDKPIGDAPMPDVHKSGQYHRIVRIVLQDGQGNILLHKRAPHLLLKPGAWDISASGHVDTGEDYEQAGRREAKEELGLEGLELKEIMYWKSNSVTADNRILNRFNKTYLATVDERPELRLEPEEVTEVRWMTVAEAKALMREDPHKMTDGLRRLLTEYFDEDNGHQAAG